MGQIIGGAAKPKRCNLNKLSQLGTPAAGEYILVSYDNSMTANGQGNFDRYIMGDGRTAATALELRYLDDSTHPYIVEEVNKAVADIQPIEITGDVTNAPDEEDLTSENQGGTDVLKFKDKAYNSALYSGLGRVYLRKNIVTLEGTGKNVLTQAMMNTANTIYHIQYDYDLNGQTITVPEGCVLEFDGGSLRNGTLVGNETQIKTNAVGLFDAIDIEGSWLVKEIYSSWFKDIETRNDCIRNLFKLNNAAVKTTIYIAEGHYNVSCKVNAEPILPISSNTDIIIDGEIEVLPNAFTHYYLLCLDNVNNVSITGSGSLIGDRESHIGTEGEYGHGIVVRSGSCNIHISNLVIRDFWGDGILVGGIGNADYTASNKDVHITGVTITNCRRQGISVTNVNGCTICRCSISDIQGTAPSSGIDLEPMDENKQEVCNVVIKDTKIFNTAGNGIFVTYSGTHNGIHNITIDNCEVQNNNTTSHQLVLYLAKDVRIYNSKFIGEKCIRSNKSERIIFEDCYFEGTESDINLNFDDSEYLIKFKYCTISISNPTAVKRCNIIGTTLTGHYVYRNSNIDNCSLILNKLSSSMYSACYSSSILNSNIIFDYGNSELETDKGYMFQVSSAKILNTTITKGTNGNWESIFQVFSNTGGETNNNIDVNIYGAGAPSIKPNFNTSLIARSMGIASGPTNSLPSATLIQNNNAIGFCYFDTTRNKPVYLASSMNFVGADGINIEVNRVGTKEERPSGKDVYIGFSYYDTTLGAPIYVYHINGNTAYWKQYNNGVVAGTLSSGTFAQKPGPASAAIYIGYPYFCTDRQTPEQAAIDANLKGIMIYYKGKNESNVNVWVDALGRVVS